MEQRFLPGMSPGLVRVAEAAKRNPGRLLSLAHHIDVEALRRAYNRIRKDRDLVERTAPEEAKRNPW